MNHKSIYKSMTQTALSDVYGKISEVLIALDEIHDLEEFKSKYGGIFAALGGRVRFVVLGKIGSEQQRAQQLNFYNEVLKEQKLLHSSPTIILEPDFDDPGVDIKMQMWVQDPFTILTGADGLPIFLEPYYLIRNAHFAEQNIAEQISANMGYLIKSTRYFFEGGNILVGDDFMVVGKDVLVKNLQHYYEQVMHRSQVICDTPEYYSALRDIEDEFKRIFGVNYVVWAGTDQKLNIDHPSVRQSDFMHQPFFHLDLYMTLGGKTEDGEELVFLADIEDEEMDKLGTDHVRLAWEKVKNMLDEVERNLVSHHITNGGPKFFVRRVPLGLIKMGHAGCIPLSLTNILIEVYGGIKIVYLPSYEKKGAADNSYWESLLSRAVKAYSDAGFKVVLVEGDFLNQAYRWGSLRCMVKVLSRKTPIW